MNYLHWIVLLSIMFSAGVCASEKGNLTVKWGAAFIQPNDDSSDLETVADSGVAVTSESTFGFTFDYRLSSHWSVELLGIIPSNHELNGQGGLVDVGVNEVADVDVLPPTLTLKYHYLDFPHFKPFVGAGLNYTIFLDKDVNNDTHAALGDTKLEADDSAGLALQSGFDIELGDGWLLSTSVWYIDINTDAALLTGNTRRDIDIDIDPWVVLIGAGKRFNL